MNSSGGASKTCPVCAKPQTQAFRPFCSRRCADVDLQRWFVGAYAIPSEAAEEGPGDSRPKPDA